MVAASRQRNRNWGRKVIQEVRSAGYAVVEDVLSDSFLQATREAMYRTQEAIALDVGKERLLRAGESGVLRLMLKYDSHFFQFLEIPELLILVGGTVSDTAIMHLQNGFILPSSSKRQTRARFQNTFHQDFP